ncbi:MAG: transcriptional repressor [bacterium]
MTELGQVLSIAEQLCQERGVRMTPQRRQVLEIVCAHHKPMGAYDILEEIHREQPRAAPPTVYRALEFLLDQGFVHRLETLNAYIGCSHPDHPHASQFLICTRCGEVTELEDDRIADSVGRAARASGFQPDEGVIEVAGQCADCKEHQV